MSDRSSDNIETDSDVTGEITRNLRYSTDEEQFHSNYDTDSYNVTLQSGNNETISNAENTEHSGHDQTDASLDNRERISHTPLSQSSISQHDRTFHEYNEIICEDRTDCTSAECDENISPNIRERCTNSFICDSTEHFYDNSSDSNSDFDLEYLLYDEHEHESYRDFVCLKEMLSDDDSNELIDANFTVTKAEMLYAILSFSKKHCLNHSATADLGKMINTFVDRKIVPDTPYRIDKLFYPKETMRYFAVCPVCKSYIGTFNSVDRMKYCEICKEYFDLKDPSYKDYFVTFNIESDVQYIIENNDEYYTSVLDNMHNENTNIEDIYNGRCYKEFYSSLAMERKNCFATITFNSDGIRIFKSSKYSGWPIHLMVNEVPIHVRNKKQILFAMWFGHDKPNMTYFLTPFIDEMSRLSNQGITCRVNNNIRNIFIYPICCVVDSVARAPMQGTTQYNGYYGCSWCLHAGKRVFHNKGYTIKYPLLDEIPRKRAVHETISQMEEAVNNGITVCGVKKVSPLINLQYFNIIEGFVPDAMHCIDLGIAKQLCEYWLTTSGKQYSIPNRYKDLMDNQIKSLKVPTQITRLSRSIKDRQYWKAREWHNWLLFYSIPILSGIPNFHPYVEHLCCLVEAYQLLLQPSISEINLQTADDLLKRFVCYTEYYYGEDAMSFNIHQLTHLTQSVANWGPLWAHFGYPFESSNGIIVDNIHAAKGVLSQVCRSLSCNQSLNLLEKHILTMEYSAVKEFCTYLKQKNTLTSMKVEGIRYFGKPVKVHPWMTLTLNCQRDHTQAYHKIVRDTCIFKGRDKASSRSDNSFATIKDGSYIQIEQFIINRLTNEQYVMYRRINVTNITDSLTSLKEIVDISPEFYHEKLENLEKLCVYIKLDTKQYIAAVPNMYWY